MRIQKVTSIKGISCVHTKILLQYIDAVRKKKRESFGWTEQRCTDYQPASSALLMNQGMTASHRNIIIADIDHRPGHIPAAFYLHFDHLIIMAVSLYPS